MRSLRRYKRDRYGRFSGSNSKAPAVRASSRVAKNRNGSRKAGPKRYANKTPVQRARREQAFVFGGAQLGRTAGSSLGVATGIGPVGAFIGGSYGSVIGAAYGAKLANKTGALISTKEFKTFSKVDQAKVTKTRKRARNSILALTAANVGYSALKLTGNAPKVNLSSRIKGRAAAQNARRATAPRTGLGSRPARPNYAKRSRAGVYTVTSMR